MNNESSSNSNGVSITNTLEDQILVFGATKPNGFTFQEIQAHIPAIKPENFVTNLNKLLKDGKLELLKKNTILYYKVKNVQRNPVANNLQKEEKIIFTLIEQAGTKGIWTRDLRFKSNLPTKTITKVLDKFTKQNLVKPFKAAQSKKVYLLFDLEPDKSITEGTWGHANDFDAEFVNLLNQQCYRYLVQRQDDALNTFGGPLAIKNKTYASTQEVHQYIMDSKISTVKLSLEDIDSIMYTIVLDGKAEKRIGSDGKNMYRTIKKFQAVHNHFASTPCGVCPLMKRCSDSGLITPRSCDYMSDWLSY